MINDIEIKNFRGINSLKIKGLKRINLIGGINNSGKTSILESINMFYSRNKYIPGFSDLRFRSIPSKLLTIEEVYKSLFNNFDLTKSIQLRVSFNDETFENMTIEVPKISSNTFSINLIEQMIDAHAGIQNFEICITVKNSKKESFKATINPKSFSINIKETSSTDVFCIPSFSPVDQATVSNLFAPIDLAEKTPEFIENLKFILPEIKNISVLPVNNQPVMFASIGLSSKIPINYLGEGTNRLLQILLAITNTRNGVVLIDEIENGFHYSVLPNLWKAIAKFAAEYNCQLFATTHSYECIQSMHEELKNQAFTDYCFRRIDRQSNTLKAVDYCVEDFDIVFDNEFKE